MTDRVKEIGILHADWLKHPVTREFISILINHQKHVGSKIALSASDDQVSDARIRNLATQLRTLMTIEVLATNTETFTQNISEK